MISTKINIISKIQSPRFVYTLDFIFKHFFDSGYDLSTEPTPDAANIYYDHHDIDYKSLYVKDSGYLSGSDILPPQEAINLGSDSFDLFSFVFYFLSRAEEYDHQSDDFFGRSLAENAHFGKEVRSPLVDIELLKLASQLKANFNLHLKRSTSFKLIHTVDIDQFYAFKNKSLKRKVGGLVSSALKANISNFKDRTKSLTLGEDPYDTFDKLERHSQGIESHYFVLVGNYDGVDNALDISQDEIREQLIQLSKTASIGLHPSVKSSKSNDVFNSEKEKLEQVLSTNISESRQHFLKLEFPHTYRQLIASGISKDYSLGYHDDIGFRAGTSNHFHWFDLEKNVATDLLLQPLLVMDVTLKKYLKLDPQSAIETVKEVIDQCKILGAPFTLLWHNSSFYDQEGWAGWEEVYVSIVNYCQELSS